MTMSQTRHDELKAILDERRKEKQTELDSLNARSSERAEDEIQDDIDFALIQMSAETIHKIDDALARLEEDDFGYCFECGNEIVAPRLRAMPFVVRCSTCEKEREEKERRERTRPRGFNPGF